MKTTNKGVELIKYFEDLQLTAYKCPAGVWTIGWGHTRTAKPGMTITVDEAEELLKQDIERAEKRVDEYVHRDLESYEYDAVVSLAFNLRRPSFIKLASYLNMNIELFKDKMLLYCYGDGKLLRGLKIRRICERLLFENRAWKQVAMNLAKLKVEQILKVEKEIFEE